MAAEGATVLEKEVKHALRDERERDRVREALARRCGEPERAFETTTWYEAGGDRAFRSVRLRRGAKNTVTYKEKMRSDDRTKTRIEHTVEVDDLERTAEILRRLGFQETVCYERVRETFRAGGAEVCLDRMPFGDFLEIEGTLADIERIEKDFGLAARGRILASYLALGRSAAAKWGVDPSVLTFAAFGVPAPPG
jgi:adenylate cyclase class 2